MGFCPKCGGKLADDAYFCSRCGVRTKKGLEAGVYPPLEELRDELNKLGQEMEKAFQTAGEEIRKAFKTARENAKQSGARDRIICPSCGEKNLSGSSFCYKCGKKLGQNRTETNSCSPYSGQ